MNKTTIILSLFLILFSLNTLAVPPFQTNTNNGVGLNIIYPETQNFIINKDIELHYHLTNSTGYIKTTNLYNCTAHVYNTTNNHIVIANLTNSANSFDKELDINGSLLNKVGLYAINIWCNTNNEAGYLSHYIYITKDGNDPENTNNGYIFISVLFGIIALILIFLYIAFNVGEEHWVLKSVLIFFSIFLILLIPRFLYYIYSIDLISNLIKYSTRITYLFVIYVVIYGLWKLFDYYGKTDRMKQWISDKFKNNDRD